MRALLHKCVNIPVCRFGFLEDYFSCEMRWLRYVLAQRRLFPRHHHHPPTEWSSTLRDVMLSPAQHQLRKACSSAPSGTHIRSERTSTPPAAMASTRGSAGARKFHAYVFNVWENGGVGESGCWTSRHSHVLAGRTDPNADPLCVAHRPMDRSHPPQRTPLSATSAPHGADGARNSCRVPRTRFHHTRGAKVAE